MRKEIWYPLKCNGIYQAFPYYCNDYLKKDRICNTKEECLNLCEKLNKTERFNHYD